MIYRAEVTLKSPLALTLRRATGNDVETLRYIPGTTFRGAMASAYLESGSPEDDDFRTLFLKGRARFGNLRIDGAEVWPISARICKEWKLEHDIADRLLATAAGVRYEETCRSFASGEPCGSKLEIPQGFVKWGKPENESDPRYLEKKPQTRRTAHSAIHPGLLKTRDGQLFSVRCIESGQVFKGVVHAEGMAAEALGRLIPEDGGRRIRMGRAKTRGNGAAHCVLQPLQEGVTKQDRDNARCKIENMQHRARELGKRLAGRTVVTVTLGTPALIWDDLLMTSDWLDPKEVGLLDGWSLAGWFSQNVRISGWHTAARVPRTELPAIAAGSCFAYIKEGDETLDFLAAWAADLEQAGIGERREEGYGEVTVCNPFHVRQAVGQ